MAYRHDKPLRTEHAGAKNDGGYCGKRAEAKNRSRHQRRQNDVVAVSEFDEELSCATSDAWVEAEERDE